MRLAPNRLTVPMALLLLAAPARADWDSAETRCLAADADGPVTLTLMLMAAGPGARAGLERLGLDGKATVEELKPVQGSGRRPAVQVTLAPCERATLRLQGSQAGTWLEALFERADGDKATLGWISLRGDGREAASPWRLTSRFLAPGWTVQLPAPDTLVLGPRAKPADRPAAARDSLAGRPLDPEAVHELRMFVEERRLSMIKVQTQQAELLLELLTRCQDGRTRKPGPEDLREAKATPVAMYFYDTALTLDYFVASDRLLEAWEQAKAQALHWGQEAERGRTWARAAADPRERLARLERVVPIAEQAVAWSEHLVMLQALVKQIEETMFPPDQKTTPMDHCLAALHDYLRVHEDGAALKAWLAEQDQHREQLARQLPKSGPERKEQKGDDPRPPRRTEPAARSGAGQAMEASQRRDLEDADARATAEAERRQLQERREWMAAIRAERLESSTAPAGNAPASPSAPAASAPEPFTLQWHAAAQKQRDSHDPAVLNAIDACLSMVRTCGLEFASRSRCLAPVKGHPKLLELRPRQAGERVRPLLSRQGQTLHILAIAPHGAEDKKAFRQACKSASELL